MNSWSIFNPRTGHKVKDCSYANHSEVFKTLESLYLGFLKWKKISFKERQQTLSKVVKVFEENQQELILAIHEEMGKSLAQTQAEIKKCLDSAKYLCQAEVKGLDSYDVPNPTYSKSHITHEPLGVVLSILPWNYPLWQGFRAFFPNLLAGNTILLKHSEVTPTTGDLIAKYFKHAGCEYLLQHCLFSHEITEKVVADARTGGVSITGSVKAGKAIAEVCAKYFKKSVLELGGSDPAIILPDADFEFSCKSVALSRLQNAGQVCISAKRLIIPRSAQEKIINQLKVSFDEILIQKEDLVGPLAQAKFKKEYDQAVQEIKSYSELIYEKDLSSKNTNEHTAFVNPCILFFKENHAQLKDLEIFGPCLVVIPYETEAQAVEIANSTIFALGASVYGKSASRCRQVAEQLKAGQVAINDLVRSDVRLPFGGSKMSGYGRELGVEGFFEFTQVKVISEK